MLLAHAECVPSNALGVTQPIHSSRLQLPELSLYVHIPWCISKCPYCDFNSHIAPNEIPEKDYTDTLLEDFQKDLLWVQGRKISSIFFGGGTPSLFSGQSIRRVIQAAEKLVGFADDIEITLEVNPGTAEQSRFKSYAQSGVNRLSIGAQTFNENHLTSLGRVHNGQEALQAIESAKNSGIHRINVDLMHGLKYQTVEDALQDLAWLIDAQVEHISWYQLTIEPNTVFYSDPPALPNEDVLFSIQQAGLNALSEGGYEQYEVSAFTKPAGESRHNVNYWKFGDYIGIGAGAHGKITFLETQDIIRTQKTRQPKQYMKNKKGIGARQKSVPIKERPLEFMMNALRLRKGVPSSYYAKRTGLHIDSVLPTFKKLRQDGLWVSDSNKIGTSPFGYRFLNQVIQNFS